MKIPARRLTLDELPLLIGRDAVRLPRCCGACGRPVQVDIDHDCRPSGVVVFRHPPAGRIGEIACGHCRARLTDLRETVNDGAARAF